jgi:proteasome accessory factor B
VASRIERLLSLINLFIGADRPVQLDQVRTRVPGYPEDRASFQRQFERDKAELRSMGLPLETIELPDTYPPVVGYRIPRERAHLRDPGLDPDELAALALAASAVRLDGIEGSGGLWKLGGGSAGPHAEGLAGLPADDRLVALFEAVAERREARFRYHDLDRTVDPWRLGCTRGRWYLTGYDHERDGTRHYRVDRIEGGVTTGPPGAFDRPQGAIEGVRMEAWAFGPGPTKVARVLVDAGHVATAVAAAPSADVVEERPDGSAVLELEVSSVDPFRSLVVGFLEHAEVLEPPELREAMVEWLTAIAEQVPPG